MTAELFNAVQTGNVNLVAKLSAHDTLTNNSEALVHAATWGKTDCVKLLIPISDPRVDDSLALRLAARYGHAECVKLLIPVSNCSADDNQALRTAAYGGYVQCVALLIPVSDHDNKEYSALAGALEGKQWECAELLYDMSDLGRTLDILKGRRFCQDGVIVLEQRIAAQKDRDILDEKVGQTNKASRRKKM